MKSSESTNTTHSPRQCSRPALRASERPPFSLSIITKRESFPAYSLRISRQESGLPSLTHTASQSVKVWASTVSRHLLRYLSTLYTGITNDTTGLIINLLTIVYPLRARAVSEPGQFISSSTPPSKTTSPPLAPASGPRSITQSAARITSGLCSTTSSEWPFSRRASKALRSFSTSKKCRPEVGSSKTKRIFSP